MRIEKLILIVLLLPLIAFFFLILLPLILIYGFIMVLLHKPVFFRMGSSGFAGTGETEPENDDVIDVEVIHSENAGAGDEGPERALRR